MIYKAVFQLGAAEHKKGPPFQGGPFFKLTSSHCIHCTAAHSTSMHGCYSMGCRRFSIKKRAEGGIRAARGSPRSRQRLRNAGILHDLAVSQALGAKARVYPVWRLR